MRLLLPSLMTVLVAVAGCRNEQAPIAPPVAARAAPKDEARCPAHADATLATDLLARHARVYGAPDAVAASLPVSLIGTATVEGQVGRLEWSISTDAHRRQLFVGGILAATGIDAAGAWTLEGGSGIAERLTTAEGSDSAFDAWLLRRSYVGAFEAARDQIRCQPLDARGARVDLAFALPTIGSPTLAFDLETAALLSVSRTQVDGRSVSTTFEAWTEADHGVRWPRKVTEHPSVGSGMTSEVVVSHELQCSRVDPSGAALPERGAPCVAPPPDRFTLRWPAPDALGRMMVTVPFTYLGGQIVVRAKLGGREVNALLDSGASVTVVDSAMPAGKSFRTSIEVEGAGSTQKIRVGFGELPGIDLGALHAEHVPTVSVPIPALDAFGDKRPELILGYAFFAGAVLRVDYHGREIVIARDIEGIFAKAGAARSVPLRVLRSKIIVDGSVEGIAAPFEVDTGNSGGLDLYKKWASVHGLPGARPVATMKGKFGVGEADTTSTFYRLARASLGPITFDAHLSHVSDSPGAGIVAGLAGNEVLARCDAVLFDVPKRALWLEGNCDREVPERRVGWRFEKKIDPAHPDRPWVVSTLWPGGPAERAGLHVGDRILEMGGKPAILDVAPLWSLEQQPAGTKLPVVFVRAGAKSERVVVELRTLDP